MEENTTHECPWPECTERVRQDMFACRVHWYYLPATFRSRIWRTYRSGNMDKHTEAMGEALAWIHKTHGA